jgi:hypothetical protein
MALVRTKFFPDIHDHDKWNSKRKKIYFWRANRATTVSIASRVQRCRRRAFGHGTVLSPETEIELAAWARDLRRDGIPVSAAMLSTKARALASEVHNIGPGMFKASHTWQQGFLRRHRLSMRARTRQGQHSNGDGIKAVRDFRQHVLNTIHAKSTNRDQTWLIWECFKQFFFFYHRHHSRIKRGSNGSAI